MFGSKLFDTVYIGHSFLSRNLKSSSNTKKNEYVANVIKKLNKENKSLFGKLLETRRQKHKREATSSKNGVRPDGNQVSEFSDKNEKLSEAWWLCPSQGSRPFNSSKKNSDRQYSSFEVSKSKSANMVSTMKATKQLMDSSQQIEFNKLSHMLNREPNVTNTCISSCEENVNVILPSLNKNGVKTENKSDISKTRKLSTLALPDIIIRNIPTFPLQNQCKETTNNMPTIGNILSIPLSLEEDSVKDYSSYPSVSKILNATMSDSSLAALKHWRQKMISELGEEQFLIYYRGLLDKGSQFHMAVRNFLSGTAESELKLDQVEGCWHSLRNVFTDISDVRVLESHVVHSDLLYRGIIDCVASYRGKPVLIEWKKSDKQKPEIEKTYDAPLQVCAYVGAVNYDAKYTLKVGGGLVVVAYSDGTPAHTFKMTLTDCNKYWKLWLLRLQKYWQLQQQQQHSVSQ